MAAAPGVTALGEDRAAIDKAYADVRRISLMDSRSDIGAKGFALLNITLLIP